MSGKTICTSDEAAEGCRDAVMGNAEAVGWLRNTLLGNFCGEPCMQSPAKQTVAYFLLGELPTQWEDLCELSFVCKPPSWWRKLLSNFVVGAK